MDHLHLKYLPCLWVDIKRTHCSFNKKTACSFFSWFFFIQILLVYCFPYHVEHSVQNHFIKSDLYGLAHWCICNWTVNQVSSKYTRIILYHTSFCFYKMHSFKTILICTLTYFYCIYETLS